MTSLISHHPGFCGDVLAQDRDDRKGLEVGNDNRAGLLRIAVNEARHLHFVMLGPLLWLSGLTADEGLVSLDNPHRGQTRHLEASRPAPPARRSAG